MSRRLIEYSLANRFVVLLGALAILLGGGWALRHVPLDAIPDLSDVQVIVFTEYPGQAPRIVEDQVTYPITTRMLAVPHAKVVRGYSFFAYSFVYVIFEDGTDPYWARSRVLEYLSQIRAELPATAVPALGPDATGVGWAFMYVLTSPTRTLQELRSLQDWYLRYQLAAVEGVSEVASVGGFVKQYQVTVDPERLRAFDVPLGRVRDAIRAANDEAGGGVLELAETEFMIRVHGYVRDVRDLEAAAVGARADGTPIRIGDVGRVTLGPDMRRGIAEWNGEGEVVGGIVVVRAGANARDVIAGVTARLAEIRSGLPDDVAIEVAYDRSELIERSIDTLRRALFEESAIVAAICVLFLWHVRSALVPIIVLPLAVLLSFIVMAWQGIGANIMSLGGVAIAIGAMIDSAIVMVENMHKHLERDAGRKPHWAIVRDASLEVGPTLFYSLLVITVSFLPIFTLEAQEGRLFGPLAYTKTYAMAGAALLSITLAPVLMGYLVRGRIVPERRNPVSRVLIALYDPAVRFVTTSRRRAVVVVVVAAVIVLATVLPWRRLGSEFMPPLYEGDLLYMPTTLPGISITKARELLQQTDRIIKTFPEVKTVFGKIGRADTATDPAPLSMIETTITLHPVDAWPRVDVRADGSGRVIAHRRRSPEELVAALDAALRIPGLTNAWTMPIKARIDMLSTGMKTPVGLKVGGPDLEVLERIGMALEAVLREVPDTTSVYAERVAGGNYLEVEIDREAIARFGLAVRDVQEVVATAVGGMTVSTTVEGLERYPINLRYPRELRDDVDALRAILVPTVAGAHVPLGQLARFEVRQGAPEIKTENGRPNTWIYVDVRGIDIGTYVARARAAVAEAMAEGVVVIPPGYSLTWSGQYEYMERARQRLLVVVPVTLLLVALILYVNTGGVAQTAIVMLAVPFSLVGAVWLLWLLDYNMSVAVWVGLIALAGIDAETGVVMLLYLDHAHGARVAEGRLRTLGDLRQAIHEGAVQRVRPKAMTVATDIVALLPIMWSTGAGADVMKRIAVPLIGGVTTSFVMELLVYPAIYLLWRGRGLAEEERP